jgi:hypothetical protein
MTWRLLPPSSAKPLPTYIPPPLRADYEEACAIVALSPKASATLARRCLQGMIRDFFGISKHRLADEIRELRRQVEEGGLREASIESLDAIDALRELGNIGAHMERDINVIVDVDPGEAEALIALLEQLFDDWYIARHQRKERFGSVRRIAEAKAEQKKLPPPTAPADAADG